MALARIQTNIINQLLKMGRLTQEQVSDFIESEEELSGEAMEKRLIADYKVTEFHILAAKSKAFNLSPFNGANYVPSEYTFEKLDRDFCVEHKVLPVGVAGDYLILVISNPFDLDIANRVSEKTRMRVHPLLGRKDEILTHLEEKEEAPTQQAVEFGDVMENLDVDFGGTGEDGEKIDEDNLEEESAPIIQLANRIIEDAYFTGGSDIHIEPFELFTRVRVRVDGVLQEKLTVPSKVAGALLARIKVMSNLDIAEKRLPQDGRIVFKQFTKKKIDIDLRVSTAPLNHGEGAVMRILDKQKSTLPLEKLGYSPQNLAIYRDLIERPFGMILHCGPTGSGKSMTLYSALNEINTPDICIRTAEDPIEYTLPGLLQMQMNRKIGLTFSNALRAFLRQDPDIILVGEIRDSETAQTAIEAALTGHMLFSTLHTNDAPSTVSRLGELGVEPFMISASLVCICAQRLMRRVCKTCRQSYIPEGREAAIIQNAIGWLGGIYHANPNGCGVG